eukprot:gene10935-3641_t
MEKTDQKEMTEVKNSSLIRETKIRCPEEMKHIFENLELFSSQNSMKIEIFGKKLDSEYIITSTISGSKYDLLLPDKFDHFEVYETITSSLEKFKEFKIETISIINILEDLTSQFRSVNFFQTVSQDSEEKIEAMEKLSMDIEKLVHELSEIKGGHIDFSHKNPKTLEDIDLIQLYFDILENCKTRFPDFVKGKTFTEIDVDLKSYKEMPMNFWLKREKNLSKLEKNTEILNQIAKKLKLLKIDTAEFSTLLKSLNKQIFDHLYDSIWKNLKYLPPDVFESSTVEKLQINSDMLKKRLLNIQIVITDTIKSHSIIHVNDELKKEVSELRKENERLKKLIEIVQLRSCLENSIFQIKSNAMEDSNFKLKWTYKTPVSNILLELSTRNELDHLWTSSPSSDEFIEKKKKTDLRKCLSEVYGQLSEVVHDPNSLELDLKYPMIIRSSHVGDSSKRLVALKEIIEKNKAHIDSSGNVLLKFDIKK